MHDKFSIRTSHIELIVIFLFGALLYRKFGGIIISNNISVFLLFTLIALILVFLFFVNKKFSDMTSFPTKEITIALLLFLLNMITSLLWTRAFSYGITKITMIFLTLSLFIILSTLIRRKFLFFLSINVLFFIFYLVSLYNEYGSIMELFLNLHNQFRLGWDTESENNFEPIDLSRYIVFGFINLIFFYILLKNKLSSFKKQLFVIFTTAIFLVGSVYLFFSGTRTPILAIVLAFGIFYLFNYKLVSMKTKIFFLSLMILFGVSLVSLYSFSEMFITKEQKDFIEYRYFDSDTALSDRASQNERALENINSYNLVFGSGSGDFGYLFTKQDIRDYPHNVFSEILYENGIFNLLIFAYLIFIVFMKIKTASLVDSYFIICFFYFLINSLFSGDLISNTLFFGFLILLFTKCSQCKVTDGEKKHDIK